MKIQPKQYAQLLLDLEEGLKKKEDLNAAIKKLAGQIKQNKDKGKLGKIVAEFERMYAQKHGLVEGEVVSAKKLTEQMREKITSQVAKHFSTQKNKVTLQEKVDDSIKGGLIIKIGNEVWDASVRTKLDKLRRGLEKN